MYRSYAGNRYPSPILQLRWFLHHNEFCGNFDGTPKAPVLACLESGKDMILELDVNGAANVRREMPEAVSVFVMPPSYEVLFNRLCGRGTEKSEVIEKRMETALTEIARAKEYDYIVVNDKIDDAVDDLISIVISGRPINKNEKTIIDEVLKNVKSSNR